MVVEALKAMERTGDATVKVENSQRATLHRREKWIYDYSD